MGVGSDPCWLLGVVPSFCRIYMGVLENNLVKVKLQVRTNVIFYPC